MTRHLEDVVTFSIRPELAGMTRLELANQLIENQSAFHFAFIPMNVWCAWRDSNSQKAGLKPAASSNWATRAS